MENCPHCKSEMEYSGPYARCSSCNRLFISINNSVYEYPVLEPMRELVESILGFNPRPLISDQRNEP